MVFVVFIKANFEVVNKFISTDKVKGQKGKGACKVNKIPGLIN